MRLPRGKKIRKLGDSDLENEELEIANETDNTVSSQNFLD
jgi:hypothetical protein